MVAAPHHDRAAPGHVGRADARLAHDEAAGREIGAGHQLDQLVDRDSGIIDEGAARIDHLAQIMGRDIGRHADRDAAGAVDQEIGETRRQHNRLDLAFIVVRLEIDGVLVDVLQQALRDAGESRLGVPHRRRRIAVHRAEIALALDQRQAHREILRHAHQRVVDRRVAVRMILAHHLADSIGTFAEAPIPGVPGHVHAMEDPAMHRLQPVADVWQRARHDHAHRVIEVRAFHLVFDGDRRDVERSRDRRFGGQDVWTIALLR